VNERSIKTIGILTSGGDCAGLNAAIRAVTSHAIQHYGWRVLGIHDATHGLLRRPVDYEELTMQLITGNILRLGGTILGTTSRGNPFSYPMPDGSRKNRSAEIIEGYKLLGLDGLIAIGGDGSFDILFKLAQQGDIPFVGIPKTIDNDVPMTEFSIGFTTAFNTAVEALDRLQPTAASHDRVMVLEVMGRDAGHIALNAGIAGGADVILIPEIPFRLEPIVKKIMELRDAGRAHALIVCSEAARPVDGSAVRQKVEGGGTRYGGVGHVLSEQISKATGAESRVTVLGHVQRGGTPSPRDRIIASSFGVHAVDLLASGQTGRMVAWQQRSVVDVPLSDVVGNTHPVDVTGTLVKTARGLGICLGDL
jgi:ATP-dependent phosphofructokinase / diphosphate-dependent phosphofructokinase